MGKIIDGGKWMAVVNVFAASKNAGSIWKNAAVMLEEAGVPYKARFTGGSLNATALSYKSAAEGYRNFIAVNIIRYHIRSVFRTTGTHNNTIRTQNHRS